MVSARQVNAIDKLLSAFIIPLQPALEKDRYKVRQAFTADVAAGHTLVVADYGQLELRLLAHMTDCKSMLEAFVLGGDFHSRTAVGMYDHIKDAIRDNKVLLEWDGEGESPLPLVKDLYASERRKAKVLNFSIAYGKTAHGLAADFKTSKEEAQATVDKWYADRFEVRQWQEKTKEGARQEGKVRTLLGRTRPLPGINAPDFKSKGHSERAAINTPIQPLFKPSITRSYRTGWCWSKLTIRYVDCFNLSTYVSVRRPVGA
eukprot:XP_001696029.1 predicted protein [Chlamydomonas reinhardtii]